MKRIVSIIFITMLLFPLTVIAASVDNAMENAAFVKKVMLPEEIAIPDDSLDTGTCYVPYMPINLTANLSQEEHYIILTWQDQSQDEKGFIIERSITPFFGMCGVNWTEIARVGKNVVKYADKKLVSSDARYSYRVKSYNGCGVSGPSNAVSKDFNPYGKIYGYARIGIGANDPYCSQSGLPIANKTVVLKPKWYGYGTHDYTTTSDKTGNFELTGIIRRVYSSGGAVTWVPYKIYVDGVALTPEILLKDPFSVRQDVFVPIN